MKRGRGAIILAASLAVHVALLAAWMSTRPQPRMVEPPVMQVALAASPRPPRPPPDLEAPRRPAQTRVLERTAEAAEPRPVEQPPDPAPAPHDASPQISPEWRVKPMPPLPATASARRPSIRRGPCKTSQDHSSWDGPPCPRGSPEEQAARYDVRKDSKTSGFAAEADRRLQLKSYRESPRTDDYPGLRCTIFHKC